MPSKISRERVEREIATPQNENTERVQKTNGERTSTLAERKTKEATNIFFLFYRNTHCTPSFLNIKFTISTIITQLKYI